MDTYTITIRNQRYQVSEEVYKAYHQHRERERYLNKLANQHETLFSFNVEEDGGFHVEVNMPMPQPDSTEDVVIKQLLINEMLECFKQLGVYDRKLLYELFVMGKGMRQLAKERGMSLASAQRKKKRAIQELKKLMKISD